MLTAIFLICVILLCLTLAIWGIRQIPAPKPGSPLAPIPIQSILLVLAVAIAIYLILRIAGVVH